MESYARLSGVFLICIQALVLLHSPPCNGDQEPNCSLPEPQHSIINKTSGSDKVLACSSCRECNKGNEPEVPCPSILGISESHGGCKKCSEGMFSSERDTKACKKCRYQFCMEQHLLHNGTCTHEEDNSYCIQRCAPEYVMNKEQAKCQPQTLTKGFSTVKNTSPSARNTFPSARNTFPSTKFSTAKNTSPSARNTFPSTEKPVGSDGREDKGSTLPISVVVVIVIFVFLIIAAVVVVVCRRLRRLEEQKDDSEGGPDLPSENEPPEVVHSQQEESNELNGPAETNGIHLEETPQGFAESTLNRSDSDCSSSTDVTALLHPNVSNIANHHVQNIGYISYTPPMNGPLTNETLVQLSTDIPRSQVARMVPEPQLPPYPVPCASGRSQWGFGNLCCDMYQEICFTFDTGPPGMDAEALAGWLKLTVKQVRHISRRKEKTDEIIKIWTAEDGNDVKKFTQILKDNGMTALAGNISTYVQDKNTQND